MGKAHPSSGENAPSSATPEARDRRRVKSLAWGAAILFLAPVVYALSHGGPMQHESRGNYALLASATSASGGGEIRLPADDVIAAPVAPPNAGDQVAPAKVAAEAPHARDRAPAPVKHDQYYCGYYAQAVTGNVTPEQAARREQTNGAVMGAIGGAVLGGLFGGSQGHSGRSSVLGASAGLLAGAAMGSSSARRAADDIRSRYDAAYSSCMNQNDDAAPNPAQ